MMGVRPVAKIRERVEGGAVIMFATVQKLRQHARVIVVVVRQRLATIMGRVNLVRVLDRVQVIVQELAVQAVTTYILKTSVNKLHVSGMKIITTEHIVTM
jgi:hypothetical protein